MGAAGGALSPPPPLPSPSHETREREAATGLRRVVCVCVPGGEEGGALQKKDFRVVFGSGESWSDFPRAVGAFPDNFLVTKEAGRGEVERGFSAASFSIWWRGLRSQPLCVCLSFSLIRFIPPLSLRFLYNILVVREGYAESTPSDKKVRHSLRH